MLAGCLQNPYRMLLGECSQNEKESYFMLQDVYRMFPECLQNATEWFQKVWAQYARGSLLDGGREPIRTKTPTMNWNHIPASNCNPQNLLSGPRVQNGPKAMRALCAHYAHTMRGPW